MMSIQPNAPEVNGDLDERVRSQNEVADNFNRLCTAPIEEIRSAREAQATIDQKREAEERKAAEAAAKEAARLRIRGDWLRNEEDWYRDPENFPDDFERDYRDLDTGDNPEGDKPIE